MVKNNLANYLWQNRCRSSFGALRLRKLKQRKNNNTMKQASPLLTAALCLAAASAYAQAAKSSPAAGAAASPSTPPTIASAIDREIGIVEKELIDAAEAMPEEKFDFSPEKM